MGIHSQLHLKTQSNNIETIVTLLLLGLAVKTVNTIDASAEWKYYGCYEPKDSHYALHHSTFESDVMTTQSCANKCQASKYKLFGLDDGGHCLCDHSVEKAQKASEDKCEAQCQSEPGEKCGTGDAIRVLKILDESDAVFRWSDWSTWGSCSDTCGPNGQRKRFQNCKKLIGKRQWPANANKCNGQSQFDAESCNTHIPCFVFKWSDWSGWNACTHSCGPNGKKKRFRKCLKITGGTKKEDAAPEKCPGRNHADIQSCNTANPCPVFKWNDWSQWGECSDTCGPDGKQKRTRQCKKITGTKHEVAQPSLCPGKSHSEEKSCNTGKKCAPKLKLTTCSQSSLHAWGDCHKAIDGDTNQDWYRKSCSHTEAELGWWKGRATQLLHVHSVRIYNRQECCPERLNNFVILVDGQECASYNSQTAFSVKRFKCDKMGHEVMIKNRIKTALTLCEVEVFGEYVKTPGTKLKLTTCSQSSLHAWGDCHKAIDGDTNQDWYRKSCSHTEAELGWWKGSATQTLHVRSVKIYNRQECCPERLNNFVILVDGQECASYNSQTAFSVKTFDCDRIGREVMIKTRVKTYLTLCEVEVFGEYVTSSPGRPHPNSMIKLSDCSQSSSLWGGDCFRAIDGNPIQDFHKHYCTHTGIEFGWWKAKTSQPMHIKEVKIFNRQDCCSERLNNFAIFVDGQECASYNSATAFSIKSFQCNKFGRELMIKNRMNGYLTLCQVQAFGHVHG